MKIKWLGHACFLIEGDETAIITDPYNEDLPYRAPDLPAEVVLVSHEHFDHNAVERVGGDPVVVRGVGKHRAAGINFNGLGSFHDKAQGAERGPNTIFSFQLEGMNLVHLGDLGHLLTDEQVAGLSAVEVMFIPVGGHFTIGPDDAMQVIERFPGLKVVFPMHYKTDRLGENFPIAPVDNFIHKVRPVKQIGSSEVTFTREGLPMQREVWVLNYA